MADPVQDRELKNALQQIEKQLQSLQGRRSESNLFL